MDGSGSAPDGRGATLALYDGRRRLRAEFAIGGAGQAVYVERGGVELPEALVLVRVWQGISSYGGFLGGFVGLTYCLGRRRLPVGLWFDLVGIGLLAAFSIGRIGCALRCTAGG